MHDERQHLQFDKFPVQTGLSLTFFSSSDLILLMLQ